MTGFFLDCKDELAANVANQSIEHTVKNLNVFNRYAAVCIYEGGGPLLA